MSDDSARPYQSPAMIENGSDGVLPAMASPDLLCDQRRSTALLVSLAFAPCFFLACCLPAVYFDEGGSACTAIRLGSPIGFMAILLGWFPLFTVPWSANWFGLAAWVQLCRGKSVSAGRLSLIAFVLAATTLIFVAIGLIPYPLFGYVLWQASFAILWVGSRWQNAEFRTSELQGAIPMRNNSANAIDSFTQRA